MRPPGSRRCATGCGPVRNRRAHSAATAGRRRGRPDGSAATAQGKMVSAGVTPARARPAGAHAHWKVSVRGVNDSVSKPDRGAPLSVVLAGGGTAGHVEPAMAVADALSALDPDVRITALGTARGDRKSTRLNSSHVATSYAVFCW